MIDIMITTTTKPNIRRQRRWWARRCLQRRRMRKTQTSRRYCVQCTYSHCEGAEMPCAANNISDHTVVAWIEVNRCLRYVSMPSHVLLYTFECAQCFPGFEEFGQHRASLDTTGQCFLLGWAAHFFSFFIAKWTVAGAGWRPIPFSFFHVCGSIIFPFPGLTFTKYNSKL